MSRGSGHNRLSLAIALLALQPLSPFILGSIVFAVAASASGGSEPTGTWPTIGPSIGQLAAIIVVPFAFALVGTLAMIDLHKTTWALVVPAVAIAITCALFVLVRA